MEAFHVEVTRVGVCHLIMKVGGVTSLAVANRIANALIVEWEGFGVRPDTLGKVVTEVNSVCRFLKSVNYDFKQAQEVLTVLFSGTPEGARGEIIQLIRIVESLNA